MAGLMATYFAGLMDLLPHNKEIASTWMVSSERPRNQCMAVGRAVLINLLYLDNHLSMMFDRLIICLLR